MPVKHGAYLGSVRCIDSLRDSCVIGLGGCWHLRSPRGKPMTIAAACHQVWVHGIGKISATKAAWLLKHGKSPAAGLIVFRACESYDCVNPSHLRCGTRQECGEHLTATGRLKGKSRSLAANRQGARSRRKLTDEQASLIRSSDESARVMAARFGLSMTTINDIRRGRRYRDLVSGASVFALGGQS
jgi:hypothetical protein